ncbi:MAG: P22 phage major capsid protein family protein [Chloroflexia bacterium]
MANVTEAIMDTAGFVPEIWGQKAIKVLRANTVMGRLVSRDTDYSNEFSKGDVLNIPYPGTFTAQDKAADTPVTLQTPSGGATVQVTLNKHKHVSFLLEDVAAAQANDFAMDRYIDAAVAPLAEAIDSDLLALATGFSVSVGTFGTDLTAATIRAAAKALDDAKVAQSKRHLVMGSKDKWALMADSALATYFAYSKPEVITNGSIGRLYGLDLHMSQLIVVDTVPAPDEADNLAFREDAIMLAMRKMRSPEKGTGAKVAHITDPTSGYIIRVVWAYNATYLATQVTLDVLYGVKELSDARGVWVKS